MKIKGLRWYIVGLLCLVTAFNYFDRQTLALLSGTLERVWGVTAVQYSFITSAWLVAYTVMNVVSGRLIDHLGTRRGLSLFVALWSGVDALHSLTRTFLQFFCCRVLLGAAEAANFPAGVKAVSEWFPMRERALAVGIFNSGTALGAALSAPVVVAVTQHFGWRWSFGVGAALSACWLVVWLAVYRSPATHPWLDPRERAWIEQDRRPEGAPKPVPLGLILRRPEAWGCVLARVFTDPISYLFAFWIPRFLQQERGFDLAAIGRYYWIPYVGLGLGNLAGGAVPDWLIRRGWTLNRARKMVMLVASVAIGSSFLLIPQITGLAPTLGLMTGAMFFHAAWANITLPAEVFPQRAVGSVAGCAGSISSLVSALITLAIGQAVTVRSFTPVFFAYSALPLAGFAAVCLLIPKLGEVRAFPDEEGARIGT
jgi:ACS family hexuronate transporter-like MFS transporter